MFGLTEAYLPYPASNSSATIAIFQAKGNQASSTEMLDCSQQEKKKSVTFHRKHISQILKHISLQVSGSH